MAHTSKASAHDQLAPVFCAMVWHKAVEEQIFSPLSDRKWLRVRG